jgi:hypothetical protein
MAPTPIPVQLVSTDVIYLWIVIGIVVMVSALVMSFSVFRASKAPAPTALITALSMLTLFSIAGGIATNNDEAWTIAAAGVGALAGSVTTLFKDKEQQDQVIEQVIEQVKEQDDSN